MELVGRVGFAAVDDTGRTALHSAAEAGQMAVLTVLLERATAASAARKLLEVRSAAGRTALLDSCASGQQAAVAVLLEAGAAPSAVDARGRCALHCLSEASGAESDGRVEMYGRVLKSLREGGALRGLLATADADGYTPLACAAGAGLGRCCPYCVDPPYSSLPWQLPP